MGPAFPSNQYGDRAADFYNKALQYFYRVPKTLTERLNLFLYFSHNEK